jgi:hypothetical protein
VRKQDVYRTFLVWRVCHNNCRDISIYYVCDLCSHHINEEVNDRGNKNEHGRNGFCDVQKKNYSVELETYGSYTLKDLSTGKADIGRVRCEYSMENGTCRGKECSILVQNGIKR